jgi:hypothetical protein
MAQVSATGRPDVLTAGPRTDRWRRSGGMAAGRRAGLWKG